MFWLRLLVLRVIVAVEMSGNVEIESFNLYRMEVYNKELISPLIEDAFSEPVLHRVVLSNIDFELPDKIWSEINVGFSFYWNEEVGFGNDVYFDSACQSIQKRLYSVGILFPYDKLGIILEILFDFIGQIPGVYLDESDIVIPKQRKENYDDTTY